MPAQTTEQLAATDFANRPVIGDAIEAIVNELRDAQAGLVAARPPSAEYRETFTQWVARHTATKGKDPWYAYVGSGMGNGPLVELLDGSVKWDMISGIGVHMFGHSNPQIVATALRAATSDTTMQGNLQFNADSIEFSELLLREAARTSKLKHCFLINSGALANETALKIAFQRNEPANRVIAFEHGFAGRTTTMAQIGDSAGARQGLPLNMQVDYVPFHDPTRGKESTREALHRLRQYIKRYPGQHACFAVELIQGEGGFRVAPREFFEPIMKLCRESGVAVWIDEIQTFGRTEQMYYFEQLGLGELIDIVTIGKMSQVCACLYTDSYNPKPGLLSATFTGSTVGFQVGRRMLEMLRDNGHYGADGRNAVLHDAFRDRAAQFIEAHPEWFPVIPHPLQGDAAPLEPLGGVGGMMRFTPFAGEKAKVMKALSIMFEEGVIAFACGHGPCHIRFLPPIGVMDPGMFDDVFDITERAFARA